MKNSPLLWALVAILALLLVNDLRKSFTVQIAEPSVVRRAVRWLAWWELMPVRRDDGCHAEPPTAQSVMDYHFADNQPPARAELPNGQVKIDHGYGW